MASRGDTKAARLKAWLEEHKPERVGESEVGQIKAALAPVSSSYLKRLLRASGVPLHPLVEGVVQDSFDELARSLCALQVEYEAAGAPGRQRIREIVIEAKDHSRWALRRLRDAPERLAEKQEVLLWLSTWLENPPVFHCWLAVRRRS